MENTKTNLNSHICHVYNNNDDKLLILNDLILDGINNNERILLFPFYIINQYNINQFLLDKGFDLIHLMKKGQISFIDSKISLSKDLFNIDATINYLNEEYEHAIYKEYTNLRIIHDMKWATSFNNGNQEKIANYENIFDIFCKKNNCLGFCQYNIKEFEQKFIEEIIYNHKEILRNNKKINTKNKINNYTKYSNNKINKTESNKKMNKNNILNDKLLNINDKILIINKSSEIIFCNNSALKLFEVDNFESVIGNDISDYFRDKDIFKDIENNNKTRYFTIFRDKHNVEITVIPIIYNNINELSYQVYIEKVSDSQILELKKLNDELSQKNDELQEYSRELGLSYREFILSYSEAIKERDKAEKASRSKSEFIANMSHELRTPLNAIIGYSQLRLINKDIDEVSKLSFEKILNAGEHLLFLINDILDMSKIESGKIFISEEKVSLDSIIISAISMVKPKADSKKIDLITKSLNKIPDSIITDSGKLRQIIINLLSNAVKFTEQGYVKITVKTDDYDKNILLFSVEDTGIGISKKDHALIFKPFEQVMKGSTKKYGGTGLGLTLSKKFVEILGGKIWVDSEENKGSTFNFTLPYKI